MSLLPTPLIRIGFATTILVAASASFAEDVDLLIVAGQSNAVGFDAKPGELPKHEADRAVLFWWRCGDPPADEHDSTSGGKWTHLRPQPLGDPQRPRQGRQYGNFAQPEGGFGPEMGLARTLYVAEKRKLAVLKVAFSGTNLQHDWKRDDPGDKGACYRALVAETRAAMKAARENGITLKPRAFVWVQGESDANARDAETYGRALEALLAAVRRDLEAADLVALVAVNTQFGGGRNQFMPTIVAQQKLVAAGDPRCEYVDTSQATTANAAHFDTKGTLAVGRWLAEALEKVEAKLE